MDNQNNDKMTIWKYAKSNFKKNGMKRKISVIIRCNAICEGEKCNYNIEGVQWFLEKFLWKKYFKTWVVYL